MDGESTTILKHIEMMEEDELEIFVDVLDGKVGPTSPTPTGVEYDSAFTTLPPIALLHIVEAEWRMPRG